MKSEKKKREFSKILLLQESALIWVITLSFLFLAGLCIIKGYTGSLPWLTAIAGLPWTAYGVSQCFYYNKSTKENTVGGIKYETVMTNLIKSYKKNENELFDEQDIKNIEIPTSTDPDADLDLDYGI